MITHTKTNAWARERIVPLILILTGFVLLVQSRVRARCHAEAGGAAA